MVVGHAVKLGHSVRLFYYCTHLDDVETVRTDWFAYVTQTNWRPILPLRPIPDMNSERWHLDVEARAQRDRVFWQLFFLDSWLVGVFHVPCGRALIICVSELRLRQASLDQSRVRGL